jgi:MarR family 2-MHQ and catechol resistance regulon transcriptional repressor
MPTHYEGSEEEQAALNLFIALMRGSEAFFSRLHHCLDGFDLTPSQFGVLETLYHLGPLTSSQIAEKHLRSRNNLSVVIRNLERDGLIVRKSCPKDRRSHWVELSPSGRVLIEGVFPRFVAELVRECSALDGGEQEQLRFLMKKLGRAAGKDGPRGAS